MRRLTFPDWNTVHPMTAPAEGAIEFRLNAGRIHRPHPRPQYTLVTALDRKGPIWSIIYLTRPDRIRIEAGTEEVATAVYDLEFELSWGSEIVQIDDLDLSIPNRLPDRLVWGCDQPEQKPEENSGSFWGYLSPQLAVVDILGDEQPEPGEPDIDAAERHLHDALRALGRPV